AAATPTRPAHNTLNLPILHALLDDLGHNKAIDLTRKFMTETEAHLQALAAISTDDPIVRDVHRLQGSAGMFGAAALHAALSHIETLCKSGDDDAARALVPGLTDVWRDTTAAYRAEGVLPQLSSLR
ncbi:MAG: Hpt domain-containing protein, partial [Paracoccaceae bacterium]